MSVIKCRCGKEILLLPNARHMGEAIEAHVEEHRKRIKNHREAQVEADEVSDDLIMQVLTKACEA